MATDTHEVELSLSKRKAAQIFEEAVGSDGPASQIKLYKQVIKLDPAHAEAMHYLAGLYLELEPLDKDEFDANRIKARKYYERAVTLGHTDAEVNLRHLTLDMLKNLAKEHKDDGDRYCCEKGQDSGITDLKNAVMMYKQAMGTYDELISLLDGIDPCSNPSEKKMIDFEKDFAETNNLILKSQILLLEKSIKKKQEIKAKESIRSLYKNVAFLRQLDSSGSSDSSDDSDNDEYALSRKETLTP